MQAIWARAHVGATSLFAPNAAVAKAQSLFLTPPRFRRPRAERDLLGTGHGFVVHARGARIAAWRIGRADRPAVVLSHGWGGRGSQFRNFVQPLEEAGYQVIVFDHVGHGYSEGRESSLAHFVDGLEAVTRDLAARGIQVEAAIGHSLGAAAIGTWLNRSGRRVRAVLVAPPHSVLGFAASFARRLGLPERLREQMQSRIEQRTGIAWKEFELPHAVARIDAPALVIHDAGDPHVPVESGLAVARAWSGARFVATRGLGHRAILRDAVVIRDAIDFLRDEVAFAPPPPHGEPAARFAPAPLY